MAEPSRNLDPYESDERLTPPALRSIKGGGETTPDRPARGDLKALEEAAATGAGEKSVQKGERPSRRSIPGGQFKFTPTPVKAVARFRGKGGKRRGPIAAIVAFLVGSGVFFGVSTAPGLAIINLQEVLLGDLNDQLATLDIRGNAVLKSKLKGLRQPGSICSSLVNIRCKFGTVKPEMLDKLRQPRGPFVVDATPESNGKRMRINSMSMATGPNTSITVTNPTELNNALRNPAFRNAMKRVYNPTFMGHADKVAFKTLVNRFKTNRGKPVFTNDADANNNEVKSRTTGEPVSNESRIKVESDGEGGTRQYIEGPDGQKHYPGTDGEFEKMQQQLSGLDEKVNSTNNTGVKSTSSLFSGAVRGVSLVGWADSACTVYNLGRAVAAASRITKSVQLAQFAMLYLSTADAIKAGDATAEDIAYLGQRFSEIDTRETVFDETSEQVVTGDSKIEYSETNNIFYGKNGWDAPGYKIPAYNDTPTLTTRSMQYMPGGGLTGSLSGTMDTIANIVPGGKDNLREACKAIQNPWVRLGGLVGGIALGIGSFGWGPALLLTGSAAISFAIPYLESLLADIIAGQVISDSTVGVEAADALFSGTAVIESGIAQQRGLKPLNKEEIKDYYAVRNQVNSDIAAAESYAARETPFDIYNQYSFLGSAARSMLPFFNATSKGVAVTLTQIPKFVGSAFTGSVPTVSATNLYKEARFSSCQDPTLEDMDIDPDIFCNIRYGLSNRALSLDTDEVVEYMIGNGFIDQFGAPSGVYAEFVTECIERDRVWGESGEEGADTGAECLESSYDGADTDYMRIYHIDNSINEFMDGETAGGQTASTEIDTASLYNNSTNIQCAEGTNDAGTADGYASGKRVEIRLCSLPNTVAAGGGSAETLVNSRVSGAWHALISDLQTYLKTESPASLGADERVRISSSFRTMEEQQRIWNNNNCDVSCTVPVARPGTSNHQMGLALDIQLPTGNIGSSREGDVVWRWLRDNAGQYGMRQLPSESWHWEPKR